MLERLPWFRCYPADYLLDTMSLTMEQHGAYWLLITHYYWNGEIPSEVNDIYALVRADNDERKAAVDTVLHRYFVKQDGKFTHSRIERELEKLGSMLRNQSKAGKASALARAPKAHKGNGATKPTQDDSPIIEHIPLNTGEEWPAHKSFADEMQRLYPVVDVPLTLKEIRAWCIANPTKRKTQAGVKRFINGWLSREQNRG